MVISLPHSDEAPAREAAPRRVLIATDTFPPDVNGASYFTHRLATGLAARGNQVHVVCQSDDGPPRTEKVQGVVMHRLRSMPLIVHPTMRTVFAAGLHGTLDRLIARVRPDVVHVQGHFKIGRGCVTAARRAGVPVVATNHFMPENFFQYFPVGDRLRRAASRLAWRDLGRVFAKAARVTTPTPIAAELLRRSVPQPVEPISCGIDLERFAPPAEPRSRIRERFALPDRDSVLFVGRLDEEKRLDDLIAAMPGLPGAQLLLAGTGLKRARLERLAARLGVADRVLFLGFVPDADLPALYGAADVFAMPSVAELQSIATLEAMATGLPVVAADAMALPHLVRPDHNGRLYRPGDVRALARHLADLLASPALRAEMGEASRRIAATHDHHHSLARFEALYAEVCPVRRAAAGR
jgi:Glycosyltransferase